jgi:RimJ/RimL family protein N-acetyltransferase
METPGACITGRIIAADDWRTLGWDLIQKHLEEDGMFGFRWVPPEEMAALRANVSATGASFYEWNGFMGVAEELSTRAEQNTAKPIPVGLTDAIAEDDELTAMQAFLFKYGMIPFSTDVLGGRLRPARSHIIKNTSGEIMAAGFTGLLQNRFSRLANFAWMGLIAVDPSCRGKGLAGRIVGRLIRSSLDDLGAHGVIAFAAPDNIASIAMLTGAGLAPRPEKSCVAAMSDTRPTR